MIIKNLDRQFIVDLTNRLKKKIFSKNNYLLTYVFNLLVK